MQVLDNFRGICVSDGFTVGVCLLLPNGQLLLAKDCRRTDAVSLQHDPLPHLDPTTP